jgi:hypothetical protein
LRRLATLTERQDAVPVEERAALARFWRWHEREVHVSLVRFVAGGAGDRLPQVALDGETEAFLAGWARLLGEVPRAPAPSAEGARIYRRRPAPRGPMSAFGYHYLAARLGEAAHAALALHSVGARWGGGDHAYEALNLVDGRRSALEIRDALAAIYGPLPLAPVLEYLLALESAGVIERVVAPR